MTMGENKDFIVTSSDCSALSLTIPKQDFTSVLPWMNAIYRAKLVTVASERDANTLNLNNASRDFSPWITYTEGNFQIPVYSS